MYDLDIIKTDTLSPSLGKEFLANAILIGILSQLAVTMVIIFRYRKTILITSENIKHKIDWFIVVNSRWDVHNLEQNT